MVLWWIRKFRRTASIWNRIFCNIINVFIITFDQFKSSLLNKIPPPPQNKRRKKYILTPSELLAENKHRKLSNKKNMLLETTYIMKMQSDSLSVGGAERTVDLAVSTVTAVSLVKTEQLRSWTLLYQMKWKCHQKLFWRQLIPSEIHSYKITRNAFSFWNVQWLMFIQRSQTPQINQCIKVMYIEISEMCLKIISPLLKKKISRYILILNYCPALVQSHNQWPGRLFMNYNLVKDFHHDKNCSQ